MFVPFFLSQTTRISTYRSGNKFGPIRMYFWFFDLCFLHGKNWILQLFHYFGT